MRVSLDQEEVCLSVCPHPSVSFIASLSVRAEVGECTERKESVCRIERQPSPDAISENTQLNNYKRKPLSFGKIHIFCETRKRYPKERNSPILKYFLSEGEVKLFRPITFSKSGRTTEEQTSWSFTFSGAVFCLFKRERHLGERGKSKESRSGDFT